MNGGFQPMLAPVCLTGGEAVLGVPDHVGDEQGKGQEHDHDQAAASQRLARLAGHGGMAGHAEESVDHRLFGEEAEADRYSEQDGKAHALPLHQHHPGVERDSPEQDQRHVGGDEQRRVREAWQGVEDDSRPEADCRPVKCAARQIEHEGMAKTTRPTSCGLPGGWGAGASSQPWPSASGQAAKDPGRARPPRASPIGFATKCSPTVAPTPAAGSSSIGATPISNSPTSRACTAICRRCSSLTAMKSPMRR